MGGLVTRAQPGQFQLKYEKLLRWGALLLVEYHMLVCSFREVLPGYGAPFYRYEKWFGLLLVIALFTYLLITVARFPKTAYRISVLLKRMVSYEQLYMVWVFVWYVVSCVARHFLLGGKQFQGDNDWWIFMTGLMALILFPLGRFMGSERAKRLIDPMLKIVLIPHIPVWGWALERYLYRHIIVFPSGGRLDIVPGGAMSFGYNQNITGAGAAIMLGLCLYMIATQKSWRKVYYAFGAVIYLAILILTNCRTSWYASVLMLAAACFLWCWNFPKSKSKICRAAAGVLLAAVCILLLHLFRSGMFVLEEKTWKAASEATVTTQSVVPNKGQKYDVNVLTSKVSGQTTKRDDHAQSVELAVAPREANGYYSGRIELYRACFKVMFSRKYCFLFGVTPGGVDQATYGIEGVERHYNHAHNFIIQMGVSFGVPTMLATIVFLISVFVRCWRVLFWNPGKHFKGYWMLVPILLFLVAEDMMESFLNVSAWSMTCAAFYLFAGWVVAMDCEDREHPRFLF